jgi:prolyl oligopeptidase
MNAPVDQSRMLTAVRAAGFLAAAALLWLPTSVASQALAPDLDPEMVKLVDDFGARYTLVGNEGPILFFQTNLDAPRERVVAIDTRQPEREHWRTVIP